VPTSFPVSLMYLALGDRIHHATHKGVAGDVASRSKTIDEPIDCHVIGVEPNTEPQMATIIALPAPGVGAAPIEVSVAMMASTTTWPAVGTIPTCAAIQMITGE